MHWPMYIKNNIYVRATYFDLVGNSQALQENRSKSCLVFQSKQLLDLFSWRARGWPTRSKYVALTYIPSSSLVICQTTGPKPLPKWFQHIVRSRASSFNWQYPLLSLRSSSSFLRLLPRLLVTSIGPFIFPSITCFRRLFLRNKGIKISVQCYINKFYPPLCTFLLRVL